MMVLIVYGYKLYSSDSPNFLEDRYKSKYGLEVSYRQDHMNTLCVFE